MYRVGESFIFSPSDLTAFLECEHLTQLERLVALDKMEKPVRDDPDSDLLSRYGDQHEHEELKRLEASGMSVARIEVLGHMPDDLWAAEEATSTAMREGASVIYQASFFDGTWRGQADFLFRVETPSDLGSWSYEVADTKLARRAKPSALVQMACYSEQIARLQGVWPEEMTVISGDGVRHRFLVSEVTSYVRFAKQRLIDAVVDESAVADDIPATYPTPVSHCRLCPWDEVCDERRREDDHLSLVARMRGDGVVKLQRAGVSTMGQLARLEPAKSVRGMGAPTVARLANQARLQVAYRDDGVLRYELLDSPGERQGLAGLPLPSHGDLFVDFEGDPWVGEHGLEYLFGVLESPDASSDVARNEPVHQAPAYKAPAYQALWAHDSVGEKAAFEAFVDLIIERLDADPSMHVYHYAPYEVQAMKKLMSRYATREAQVDRLLRGEVMVDLYRVVSQGVRVSLESYGLKKLEPFYWPQREGAISDGAASVTAYEIWREIQDDETLQELQDYNELDCRSTLALRDWLETLRSELETVQGGAIPRFDPNNYESPEAAAKAEAQAEDLSRSEQEASELVMSLLVGVPAEPEARTGKQQAMWLLAQLVGWHRREAKPKWWAWFDRLARTDEELVTDTDSIGELAYVGDVGTIARSIIHRYEFDPVQEHKIKTGDNPTDPRTQKGAGEVYDLDQQNGFVDFKRGKNSKTPHPRSLIPARPFGDQALRMGVVRVAEAALGHGLDGDQTPFRAVSDVVAKVPSRFSGIEAGTQLGGSDESGSDAAVRLAQLLDSSYLAVQGPPGSGKTFTGARLIVALVQAGHRVGITAHSHKAIDNLLDAVCARAKAEGVDLRAVRKVGESASSDSASGLCDPCVQLVDDNEKVEQLVADGQVDVVAGTAWLMSREPMVGALHTLVIDEAGQFSLANMVAVGAAANNLVLLGDPQQLSSPIQAIHPVGADVSALEHILDGAATIAPERGLFLERSFRMHPEICNFVSQLAYDSRLQANEVCAIQRIEPVNPASSALPRAGLGWMPITHEGNRTRSVEEAGEIFDLVSQLLDCSFTNQEGMTRPLGLEDIMVIAPYNAQVALLSEVLPAGVRVGTVDRFQGQEAPVVIYSLAASSADEVPRGLDFLFSPNRFNVAISRAQALAIVVGCPTLLRTRCRRPEQLRLVNALCRFVEQAHLIVGL